MIPILVLLVIIGTHSGVDCSCLEVSTEGATEGGCVLNGSPLPLGQKIMKFHPVCMSYECVRENVVKECGLGYNDKDYPRLDPLDSPGFTCTETKNPDCSAAMECVSKPVFSNSNVETPKGLF